MPSLRHDQGFSLVELMIAVTIGLMLLGGVIQVFVASKQGFMLQQGVARAQEGGRTGIFILTRTIRLAGYHVDPKLLTTDFQALFPAGGEAVIGTEGGAGPDTIIVRYQGNTDGTIVDCLGNPVNTVVMIKLTYTLSAPDATTGLRSLTCQRDIPAATPAVTDANPIPLMDGVTSFQVQYGIDSAGSDGVVDQYVNADQVADWTQAIAVRITLVTNSIEKVGAGSNGVGNDTNQRLIQTYSQTIDLRNL